MTSLDRVTQNNEIMLNGVRYPLRRRVSRQLVNQFPGKIVIGDTTRDSRPRTSILAFSTFRGGIGQEHIREANDADRCWWSNMDLSHDGHLILPPLATRLPAPTVPDRPRLIGELNRRMYGVFNRNILVYDTVDGEWSTPVHVIPEDESPIYMTNVSVGDQRYLVLCHSGGMAYSSDGVEWLDISTAKYATPDRVGGLEIMSFSHETITLRWNEVANADSYVLEYRRTVDANYTVISTTELIHTITGLAGAVDYTLRVKAIRENSVSDGPYSGIVTQATLADPPPNPTQVLGLAITPRTSQITASWEPVSNATLYILEWREGSSGAWTTIDVTETQHTVTMLDADTDYEVRVKARRTGALADGPYSAIVSSTTSDVPNIVNFRLHNYDHTAADFLFDNYTDVSDGGPIVDVYIEWREGSSGPWTVEENAYASFGLLVLFNLEPLTMYQVRAHPVGLNNTFGNYTEILEFTTPAIPIPAPGQVTGLRTTDRGEFNLSIAWNAVADATGYIVNWRRGSSGAWNIEAEQSTTAFALTGLDDNTAYQFRVMALRTGAVADGAWSATFTATTESSLFPAPGAVSNFRSTGHDEDSISYDWNNVANATGYEFNWRQGTFGSWNVVNRTSSSHNLTGLVGGTIYQARVRAIRNNSVSPGPWSNRVQVTTTEIPMSNVGQANVAFSRSVLGIIGAGTIYLVRFFMSAENATSMQYEWRRQHYGGPETSGTDSSTISAGPIFGHSDVAYAEFSYLVPGYIRLRARGRNSTGYGEWSNEVGG